MICARTRYGTAHPERVKNALWEQAVDEGWSGYALRQHLGIDLGSKHSRQDFSHSDYRDTKPGPFWNGPGWSFLMNSRPRQRRHTRMDNLARLWGLSNP